MRNANHRVEIQLVENQYTPLHGQEELRQYRRHVRLNLCRSIHDFWYKLQIEPCHDGVWVHWLTKKEYRSHSWKSDHFQPVAKLPDLSPLPLLSDYSLDMVFTTPCEDIPTAVEAVEKNCELADKLGYKVEMLLGHQATIERYKQLLTAGVKVFGHIGHGNTTGISLWDGMLRHTWFSQLEKQTLKPAVLFLSSCQVFNDPLKSAIEKAQPRTYAGGIVNLRIGPAEKTQMRFWDLTLQKKQPIGPSLAQAEKECYPQEGAHGILGDVGLF